MSHQPERPEKNCLNCGATVAGRYCQHCGQENTVRHMRFMALIRHFIYDIFHFDGKFFDTLWRLFFRPGLVAREYIDGRRMKFLDPIRMYLFTSAFFFLLFFWLANPGKIGSLDMDQYLSRNERLALAMELNAKGALNGPDTMQRRALQLLLDSTLQVALQPADSTTGQKPVIAVGKQRFVVRGAADSLPGVRVASGTSWLDRQLNPKIEKLKTRYRDNPSEGIADALDSFLHRLPYLLFLSLPFFALILKLLYLRNKRLFYFDHAIFTLYHYVFSFILLLVLFGMMWLEDRLGWGILSWIITILVLVWPVHLYAGMKRFYGQGRWRTFGKFLLLNGLGLLVLLLLFLGFLLFSILTL